MSEDWFEVAYINFDEAILHGRMKADPAQPGVEQTVRVTLSDEQKRQIEDLNFRHQMEMDDLLRGFAAQSKDSTYVK